MAYRNQDHRRHSRFSCKDTDTIPFSTLRVANSNITVLGQVQDISSRGIAFDADTPLSAGLRLRVSMDWPAKLDHCLLRLTFEGTVRRTHGNLTVVSIERPAFRTAGRNTAGAREEIGALALAMGIGKP